MPVMRDALLAALICLAAPAGAWQFSPTPICTLDNLEDAPHVRVTYDGALYAIHLSNPAGWPDAPVFALRFEGGDANTISTGRHAVEGDTLTVTDSGFGNVLNGLQFNGRAVALLGETEVPFDLSDAAAAVAAFRTCEVAPSV